MSKGKKKTDWIGKYVFLNSFVSSVRPNLAHPQVAEVTSHPGSEVSHQRRSEADGA